MLRCQWFVYAALAQLLRFKLCDPAPDGALTNFHILADLADTESLDFDLLCDLELESRVRDSSGFLLVHLCRRLGLK